MHIRAELIEEMLKTFLKQQVVFEDVCSK